MDMLKKINKNRIRNKWYSKIVFFLSYAEYDKEQNYWWTWKDNLFDSHTRKQIIVPLLEEIKRINPESKRSRKALKIDYYILIKAINFWRNNYERKWIKQNIDIEELKVYRCEYYNPKCSEVEYRPCIFKKINNFSSKVMIFYFSSRDKPWNRKNGVKIKEMYNNDNANSFFINTWTKIKNINEIVILDYYNKNKSIYIEEKTFYQMLSNLYNSLQKKHINNEEFTNLKKYNSIIRNWKKQYKSVI
ncbi:hypothetical protein [Spiroplasma phoeniceum]|uniref:Uncharacterized protein n=1 Tax=Spiroplasma phoeniceum P40 TaxID=1276259 RepID=A0A345DPS4_9MOLU|nr:hypothetical protein [Spiroplasma phoeniceum]AXF96167.1 hypothetical protein SDAV_001200 [Spiroplasma phoeniceum P40]AXF96212.1 hypothetical protein SDAV_001245 [Spiroplasma phoeniceum P40]